jgi:hypothetical protein
MSKSHQGAAKHKEDQLYEKNSNQNISSSQEKSSSSSSSSSDSISKSDTSQDSNKSKEEEKKKTCRECTESLNTNSILLTESNVSEITETIEHVEKDIELSSQEKVDLGRSERIKDLEKLQLIVENNLIRSIPLTKRECFLCGALCLTSKISPDSNESQSKIIVTNELSNSQVSSEDSSYGSTIDWNFQGFL